MKAVKAEKKATKAKKIADVKAKRKKEKAKIQFSKEASDKVQRIYEEKGVAGAMDIIDQFKPITNRIAEKRREAPNYDKELLMSEIEIGERGILDLIREYKPESGVPLAAYINKFLPARAIEASKRVLGKEFTEDITEKVDVAAEEVTPEIKTKPKRKKIVLADRLGVTKEVSKAIAQWEKLSQHKVGAAYKSAYKILSDKGQDLFFDASAVSNTAQSLKQGIQAITTKGDAINVKPLQAELLDVVNQITKLPPESMTFDVLNAFRQRVYDLKQIPTGQVGIRQEQKQAMELYDSITKTIQNPTNKDGGFVKAWNKANTMASKRFKQLDEIAIINAAGTETPALLAKRLFSLNEPTTINTLKKMFYPGMRRGRGPGSAEWSKVQDAFIAEFLSNSKTLDFIGGTSTQSIKAILGSRANSFIKSINDIYKIQKNGLNMMNSEELAKPFIDNLLSSAGKNLNQVKKLVGNMSTDAGTQVRAGIIDNIIRRSATVVDNVETISAPTYQSIIKDYSDKGILDFLTTAERKA